MTTPSSIDNVGPDPRREHHLQNIIPQWLVILARSIVSAGSTRSLRSALCHLPPGSPSQASSIFEIWRLLCQFRTSRSQVSSSAGEQGMACLLVGLALFEIRDQRAELHVRRIERSRAPERAEPPLQNPRCRARSKPAPSTISLCALAPQARSLLLARQWSSALWHKHRNSAHCRGPARGPSTTDRAPRHIHAGAPSSRPSVCCTTAFCGSIEITLRSSSGIKSASNEMGRPKAVGSPASSPFSSQEIPPLSPSATAA
jgi:hypothetical protein